MSDDRQESFFMHAPSEEVNAKYLQEKEAYLVSPCAPCSKAQALKLLKKFQRTSFRDFWYSPIDAYLTAVSQGIMKLQEQKHPHDEAIAHARSLIAQADEKALARDLLYGIAHNAPEYRTALACYHYIKNLSVHEFDPLLIGNDGRKDIFSQSTCEICQYDSALSDEPKMQFWHINVDMGFFYIDGLVPSKFTLDTAILYLEEYFKQPRPHTSPDDLAFFQNIIQSIEGCPSDTTPAGLRKILKAGRLHFMTNDQIEAFIDMLGYLNILHKPGTNGVTAGHTPVRDMEDPPSIRSYFTYPVSHWKRSYGIDYASIEMLFDGIYE